MDAGLWPSVHFAFKVHDTLYRLPGVPPPVCDDAQRAAYAIS